MKPEQKGNHNYIKFFASKAPRRNVLGVYNSQNYKGDDVMEAVLGVFIPM